jgi:hypothetical protein
MTTCTASIAYTGTVYGDACREDHALQGPLPQVGEAAAMHGASSDNGAASQGGKQAASFSKAGAGKPLPMAAKSPHQCGLVKPATKPPAVVIKSTSLPLKRPAGVKPGGQAKPGARVLRFYLRVEHACTCQPTTHCIATMPFNVWSRALCHCSAATPKWSVYQQELEQYKRQACETSAPSDRPLVK